MKPHTTIWSFRSPEPGAIRFGVLLVMFACSLTVVSCPVVRADSSAGTLSKSRSADTDAEDDPLFNSDSENDEDDVGVDVREEDLRDQERITRVVPLFPEPLNGFFEAIESMETSGEGRVRIMQYGDSHTAADFLTTSIRRGLQDRFGDGGRGFVLLGKPWRSYRPKDVETSASMHWRPERILVAADPATLDGMYGLGGISVEAEGAGAWTRVATTRGPGYGRLASSFEVFYLAQPEGGSFRVLVDGVVRATVSTAAAAPREGFLRLKVDEGEHEFEIRVQGDGQVRLFGAVVENDGPGVVYDTLGVNGGFFYTPLRWDADLLASDISRRAPDLLVTMYGTNEVDSREINRTSYKAKVVEVMVRFREGAPEASCLMLGPPDRVLRRHRDGEPSQLDWIIEVQQEVADEIGCAFLDIREMMGGEGSHQDWSRMRPALAQHDGIHLTVLGYSELGERIAGQLIDAYETYLDGRSTDEPAREE